MHHRSGGGDPAMATSRQKITVKAMTPVLIEGGLGRSAYLQEVIPQWSQGVQVGKVILM